MPAAGPARSPRCSSTWSPTGASTPWTSRRRWSSTRKQALGDRVTAYCQDLTELSLPEPVDAIFSNATFHWIPDHPKLFAALAAALKPGGQLVAQCGGFGNIDGFRITADEVARSGEFAPYFTEWKGPWNYARADITAERLSAAGFVDVETWLEPRPDDAR